MQELETIPAFAYIVVSTNLHNRSSAPLCLRDSAVIVAPLRVLLLLGIAAPGFSFSQPLRPENPIAKAGNVFITEDEFVRRFELLPAFGRHRRSQIVEAKAELAYSMIAEKLLAQEAEAQGMDKSGPIVSALDEIRKMLARDELYRREITGAVRVDEKELVQGVVRAKKQLLVGYLYFRDEADARFIRGRLKTRSDAWAMTLDPTLHAERDTVTVVWGEADPAIEDAAYRSKPGDVSPVVTAGGGYYILMLEREQANEVYGHFQTDALVEKVRTVLRLRKERPRLDEFMGEVLKSARGFAVGRNLRRLADACAAATEVPARDSVVILTPQTIDRVRRSAAALLADSIAVVDSTVWTGADILDRLAAKSLTLPSRDSRRVMIALDGQIRVWVQQELMAREALRRRVDTIPGISERIALWKQYLLSERLKDRLKISVRVTDSEAWSFLRSMDTTVPVPRVRIRELRTGSLDALEDALADLEHGASFEQAVEARSNDVEARRRQGLSGWFPITARYPVGEIAWSMRPGERYGPVNVAGGYLYFELVEKDSIAAGRDTALAVRLDDARREMMRLKQNRRVSLYLAQSAVERGFALYDDRLKNIAVSPVPMMTFRILGFGGRMFEVPFVDKQIEWLGIEPPASKILP